MRYLFRARRRELLRAGLAGSALGLASGARAANPALIALVSDPADPIASAAPVRWALHELQDALASADGVVRQVERIEEADANDLIVFAASATHPAIAPALTRARVSLGDGPERLALLRGRVGGRQARIACGSDATGLMYALLELADRLRTGSSISEALALGAPVVERPSNPVRCIMRQFVSEPLDKGWFNDREMWPHYLSMLAAQRFNRLHLAFGLGYDTLRGVTDSYLLFLYPFLVDVPGYNVSVTNLSVDERAANLAMLRFISEQTVAHGLQFQLGIWTHGYELLDSPDARHHVQGLTPETHAAYCRDALTAVLRACPAISSVGIRFHGESGIVEGSYDFWQTVYQGVPACGRSVEIDLHAKGVDQAMIERARSTGMPVNVSEKCWAEHHGMAYHQADIRPSERPAPGQVGRGLLTLSEGSLSFTRYGYADLLREDRNYTVRHRVFAGTQRILLSGDPAWASAYSQRFTFCGSDGFDLMEPLTCRGRRGTGIPGTRRSGYATEALEPRYDWEKYAYWYRVWGRLTYNHSSDPAAWRRHFGGDAQSRALVSALARASRILPIVSSAHMPSAACDAYWPEIYWAHAMVGEPAGNLYWDTPSPKDFQHATPHDPQLFTTIAEHADELLNSAPSGRYSPIEVAQWLEAIVVAVEADLVVAGEGNSVDTRRIVIDVRIQAGLGQFLAAKFRAGVLFALHERSNDRRALEEALRLYRDARAHWAALSETANVYADDLSVSDKYSERKHWREQLPLIDEDIARLEARLASAVSNPSAAAAIAYALATQSARARLLEHTPPAAFTPGAALPLEASLRRGVLIDTVRLFYRHVNQAERWEEIAMSGEGRGLRAAIPGAYTESAYPLQYYFIAIDKAGAFDLSPGFGAELTDEPYIVLRRA